MLLVLVGGAALTTAALATDGPGSAAATVAGSTALFLLVAMVIVRSTGAPVASELGPVFTVGALLTATTVALTSTAIVLAGGGRFAAWAPHPNLWGAHLVAGFAVAVGILMRRRRGAAIATGLLGVVAIAATGSRTAVLAMAAAVLFAVLAPDPASTQRRRVRTALFATLALALVAAVIVSLTPLGPRLVAVRDGLVGVEPTNRLAASEELTSALWTPRDVTVERLPDEEGVAVHRLGAGSTDGLARLHQRVVIPGEATLVMGVEFGPEGNTAGLLAFGEPAGRLSVQRDGKVLAAAPELDVTSVSVEELEDGWTRLHVTARLLVDQSRVWRVGYAPSLMPGRTDSVRLRRPSIVWGDTPLPYVGTTVRDRESALAMTSALQRMQYVPLAFSVAGHAWWVGHGRAASFAELADEFVPGALDASDRPTHAHSLMLDLLVTHGALGVLGFGLMVVGWWMAVPRDRRGVAAPLVAALVVANLGDSTLFTGGPEYALLAFLLLHADAPTEA